VSTRKHLLIKRGFEMSFKTGARWSRLQLGLRRVS
jgi:hypothetical protein